MFGKGKYSAKLLAVSFIMLMILPYISLSNGMHQEDYALEEYNQLKDASIAPSLVWDFIKGIAGTGASITPRLEQLESNASYLVIPTDLGISILSQSGAIVSTFVARAPVIDFEVISDINEDGWKEIVLVILDNKNPNIICIDSKIGKSIWKFNPIIEGFDIPSVLPKNFTTRSWDASKVKDINDDGMADLVISSWYRLYALSGKDGSVIWKKEDKSLFLDDIFRVVTIPQSIGPDKIVLGTELGGIFCLNSKTGQFLWNNSIKPIELLIFEGTTAITKAFPVSVTDLYPKGDNLLVGANDGYLYLFDANGIRISELLVFNITKPKTPLSVFPANGELYNYEKRIFQKAGMRVLQEIDVSNNGSAELLIYTNKLKLSYESEELVNLGFVSLSSNQLYLMNSKNFSGSFSGLSYPLARKVGSETRLYFLSSNSANDIPSDLSNSLFYLPVSQMGNISTAPVFLIAPSYEGYSFFSGSTYMYQNVLCEAWNIQGAISMFSFNRNGHIRLLNTQTSQIVWKMKAELTKSDVKLFEDINGDGEKEILVSNEVEFNPEWKTSSQSPIGVLESNRSINSLKLIYGNNGSIIWNYQNPSTIYQGLRDLIMINDIDGDGVNDIASWIVPYSIPSEIKRYVQSLQETTPNLDFISTENTYRALLANYTRVIAISGKTGEIIRNLPMIDLPYRFARYSTHSGTYLNPSSENVADKGYIYHRTNLKADSSWSFDMESLLLSDTWNWNTLINPNSLNIMAGNHIYGSVYDLYGLQSESLKVPLNNYSLTIDNGFSVAPEDNSIAKNDYFKWDIISQSNGTFEKVALTVDYQPELLSFPLQLNAIEVSYAAKLSKLVGRISVYAYAYNNFSWTLISDNSINTTSKTVKLYQISNLNDYRSASNITKLKLEITELENFNISIDQLMVNYVFSVQNYTIESVDTGSQNSVIFDTQYTLDLSNEKMMGSNNYILSQIERLSAIKIQSMISLNLSSPTGFTYKYDLWNHTSNSWVSCDWVDGDSYWNTVNGPFQKLKGGYSTNYRTSPSSFSFSDNYREDSMWVQVRGTRNYNPAIAFDYQNKTDLSHFVNASKQVKIRVNVTSTAQTFKLRVSSLGLQAFYWDIIPMRLDKMGIYNFQWNGYDDSFIKRFIVQGFTAVNGTGDSKLDIMAVTTYEEYSSMGISNIYRLFDLFGATSYSIWSTNTSAVPYSNSKIEVIDYSQPMNLLITGNYDFGKTKRVSSVILLSSQSYFQNLSNYEPISYSWSVNFTHYYAGTKILPSLVQVRKDGTKGLALVEYDETGNRKGLQIIDLNTLSKISQISMQNLVLHSGLFFYEINNPGKFTPYLKMSLLDINGDGWLDHAALYQSESRQTIKVISGNPASMGVTLSEYVYNDLGVGMQFSDQILITFSVENGGNLAGDGKDVLIVSKEVGLPNMAAYGSTGSVILYLKENGTLWSDWILTPISSPEWISQPVAFSTFKVLRSIGDLNGDGIQEILINRKEQGGGYSITETMKYEIFDVRNKKMLFEFSIPIDNVVPVPTMGGNVSHFIASVGSMLIAVNTNFKVEFRGLSNNQQMSSSQFVVEWLPKVSGNLIYEFSVNGTSYGVTTTTNQRVSLSSGDKNFVIKMYDEEGLVIAMDSLVVNIPSNQTMMIITIVMLSAIVAVAIVYKAVKNKKMKQVLVEERKIQKEAIKND